MGWLVFALVLFVLSGIVGAVIGAAAEGIFGFFAGGGVGLFIGFLLSIFPVRHGRKHPPAEAVPAAPGAGRAGRRARGGRQLSAG